MFKKFLLAALLWSLSNSANATIAVVVNPANPIQAIELDAVRKIYLGKTRTFPNNAPVIPADQDQSSPLYEEFLQKVLEKSMKEVKAYWSVRIFTGRGTPPVQLESDQAIIQWLQRTPVGIGYINANSANSTVRVILRIP